MLFTNTADELDGVEIELAQTMEAVGREPLFFGRLPTLLAVFDEVLASTALPRSSDRLATDEAAAILELASAFCRSAGARGRRVLLVEVPTAHPVLAALASPDAEPLLLDLYDELRIALAVEGTPGCAIMPWLPDGAAMAARLARSPQTGIVADLAAEFDMIVALAGGIAGVAQFGLVAEAYLRIGDGEPPGSDAIDRFLIGLGAPAAVIFGNIERQLLLNDRRIGNGKDESGRAALASRSWRALGRGRFPLTQGPQRRPITLRRIAIR